MGKRYKEKKCYRPIKDKQLVRDQSTVFLSISHCFAHQFNFNSTEGGFDGTSNKSEHTYQTNDFIDTSKNYQ